MSKPVFTEQKTNAISGVFPSDPFTGWVQVNVKGVLDSADLMTYQVNDSGGKSYQATCSWRTSAGETITGGSGVGIFYMISSKIQFEILNAGALTDLTVTYDIAGA